MILRSAPPWVRLTFVAWTIASAPIALTSEVLAQEQGQGNERQTFRDIDESFEALKAKFDRLTSNVDGDKSSGIASRL